MQSQVDSASPQSQPRRRVLPIVFGIVVVIGLATVVACKRFTDDRGSSRSSKCFKTSSRSKRAVVDRLAAEGVRFRNAFVTLSLCAPSRAAFLTGRYNHLNGITNNNTPFPADSVTHASLLRAAGYKTAYIGKWHMGNQRGQRPGFDYSASYVAHGRYQDCPFEINGTSAPTKGWVDDVAADFAIEYMKQNKEQPFSIVLGFKSPHGPCRRKCKVQAGRNSPPVASQRSGGSRSSPNTSRNHESEGTTFDEKALDLYEHAVGGPARHGQFGPSAVQATACLHPRRAVEHGGAREG